MKADLEAYRRLRGTSIMVLGYLIADHDPCDDIVYMLAKSVKEAGADCSYVDDILAKNEKIRCMHGVLKTRECPSANCDAVNHGRA